MLKITDPNGNEFITNLSEENEEENPMIKRETTSGKLYLFIKRYFKQLRLVFQSIIPDLKSFKYWQIIILILYAIFNVTFSIVVKLSKRFFSNEIFFCRISIHFFPKNKIEL